MIAKELKVIKKNYEKSDETDTYNFFFSEFHCKTFRFIGDSFSEYICHNLLFLYRRIYRWKNDITFFLLYTYMCREIE